MAYIEKRLRGDKVTYRARYRDPSGRERSKLSRLCIPHDRHSTRLLLLERPSKRRHFVVLDGMPARRERANE